jgi:hypothetical protein
MVDRKVVPFDEVYYQLKLTHVFQKHPVYELSDSCLQFHTNTKYIHSKEQSFYYSPPILSFSLLSLLFHFSFIHLSAVFVPYFSPFPSLPLSHFAACVRSSHCPTSLLHLLSSPSVHSCSLSPRPTLNLAIIFLSHSLPSYCTSILYSLSSLLLIRVLLCTIPSSSVSPLSHPI